MDRECAMLRQASAGALGLGVVVHKLLNNGDTGSFLWGSQVTALASVSERFEFKCSLSLLAQMFLSCVSSTGQIKIILTCVKLG